MRFRLAFFVLFIVVCGIAVQSSLAESGDRAANWYPDSHSKKSDPSYTIVFPTDRVNTLSIRISPDDWQSMQDNMVQLYGEAPKSEAANSEAARLNEAPTVNESLINNAANNVVTPLATSANNSGHEVLPTSPTVNISGQSFALNALPASVSGISANPIWIKADISFNGRTWNNVGVRYKGNSSLSRSWLSGTKKMPFKFDFDEFEDDFPEIKNQRFYGFKQLLLNNNIGDASYLRDVASYKIMSDMGLAAPKTAWYEVHLDYGQGFEQLGIYTMIEVLDDTVIESYYGSDKGNIYEADGTGASLSRDTVAELMESFQKENNKDSDYSDLAKLFQVLHANYRTSEVDRWQAELEAVFDVDGFLKWLATNTVIQNWDTYGAMGHNFYLYKVPETGQFSWIGWDYNEAMGARAYGSTSSSSTSSNPAIAPIEGNTLQPMQTRGLAAITSSLDHASITDDWPLIRFLLDNPYYFESYKAYVEEAISTACNPESLAQAYAVWSTMLRPYAEDVVGFEAEVERLRGHGEARAEAVYDFLNSQETIAKVANSE